MAQEIWINPGYSQKGFSRTELRDIAISIGALALAFTLIYARRAPTFFSDDFFVNTICWIATSRCSNS